jgi:hypothetical protein
MKGFDSFCPKPRPESDFDCLAINAGNVKRRMRAGSLLVEDRGRAGSGRRFFSRGAEAYARLHVLD